VPESSPGLSPDSTLDSSDRPRRRRVGEAGPRRQVFVAGVKKRRFIQEWMSGNFSTRRPSSARTI
jgi:hypothetical protein